MCGMVGEREGISVRISEPGHGGPIWRAPDSRFVLRHTREALEMDASIRESFDSGRNVLDLPTKRRVSGGLDELNLLNPQARGAGSKNERKGTVFDKAKAQGTFVEPPRRERLGGCYESNERGGIEWQARVHGCSMAPNVRHERQARGREAAFGTSARWRSQTTKLTSDETTGWALGPKLAMDDSVMLWCSMICEADRCSPSNVE